MQSSTSGFVLKLARVKENDLIVNIFTQDYGVRAYYLKNVGVAKSKRRPLIEILNFLKFTSHERNTGLAYIEDMKLLSDFELLKNPANMFAESFILAELLLKFLAEEVKYELLWNILASYNALGLDYKKQALLSKYLLIHYSLQLLQDLGFLPELDFDHQTGEKLDPGKPILALRDEPGYIQVNSDIGEAEVVQGIKVQKYFLAHPLEIEKVLQLQLTPELANYLLKLQLQWHEAVLERELQSKFLLKL